MNVLFIGGTGIISTAVVELCVKNDINVTVFNRGNNNKDVPKEVNQIIGDYHNKEEVKTLLLGMKFDTVVNFIAFGVDQVQKDYEIFKDITNHYVFISSASAYQKPVQDFPITEETPLFNPFWEYSRNKQHCEEYLQSIKDPEFHITIIRPSHTYNDKHLMLTVKEWGSEYSLLKRIIEGKEYIIPGDGTSLWTITHNTDFAKAFIHILGNKDTFNEVYHITSDKVYTWEQLYRITCKALNVEPNVIYIPTEFILKYLPHKEGEFLGDKHYSVIFDNTKIKSIAKNYQSVVKYEDIAPKAIKYYLENKEMQVIDENYLKTYQKIIDDYKKNNEILF